jgi:hypothetical protein
VGIEKALLRLDTDFIDENVAGIAEELVVVHVVMPKKKAPRP